MSKIVRNPDGYEIEQTMSDLIKRSDAIKDLCDISNNSDMPNDWHRGMSVAISALYRVPPVPPADRPQGEWIRTAEEYIGDDVSGFYDYHWACSECEKEAIINEWNIYELSDYCPHCGAKMKGTDDETV